MAKKKIKLKSNLTNTKIIYSIIFILILLGLGYFFFSKFPKSSLNPKLNTNTGVYHDPDGYFSINIPKNWSTNVGYSNQYNAETPPRVVGKIETINFQSLDGMSIKVDVGEFKPLCPRGWINNDKTTLAGLPAFFTPEPDAEWSLYFNNASISIQYKYPGMLIVNPGGPAILPGQHPVSNITPVPQSISNKDRQIVNSIIATIHPKETSTYKPLDCVNNYYDLPDITKQQDTGNPIFGFIKERLNEWFVVIKYEFNK